MNRGAAASALGNATLRRVVGAYSLFIASEYGAWIAILVWAYGHGGATEAGAIAVAQLVPAAVAAPLIAALADRRSPGMLLVGGYVLQAASLAATAVAAAAGIPVLVWLFAILAATAVVTTRPAQAALIPAIVHRVEELAAANATLGWVENGGVVMTGVVTGAVLGAYGASAAIGVTAGFSAAAAGFAAIVRKAGRMAAEDEAAPLGADLRAGLAAVRESRAARVLLGLQTALWVVVGALDILFVVLAIHILRDGAGWVGYLNTAFGVGGVLGGVAAVGLVGSRRLSLPILLGGAGISAGLGLIALASSTAAAVVLLVCAGTGNVFFDVATRTLLQRTIAPSLLGRVFGLVEGLSMAGLALGSLAAPLLVAGLGARGAFVGVAFVLPVAGAVAGRSLLRLDRSAHVPVVEIALLRSLPLFRLLPGPALETAARALTPVELAAGDVLIREGDPEGDRFYALAAGEVDVVRGGTHVARLGRGEGVGEMALLRPGPRTATVAAVSDVLAYALGREDFLVAVTGHAQTVRAADSVVGSRLSQLHELGLVADGAAEDWRLDVK